MINIMKWIIFLLHIMVKDKFKNSYVLESDLVLYNPDIIRKYEYYSNFLGKKVERNWWLCFESKNGIITKRKIRGI